MVFAIGREHGFDPLRAWFAAIYEVLLGAAVRRLHRDLRHPETVALIDAALAGRLVEA